MFKAKLLTYYVALLTFAGLFYQCTDDHHSRYEDPPWFDGTNIQTLEKNGNYDIFLALMDKAEYRTSIENQMFTIFAASDSSFNEYFKSIGVSSVEDLSPRQAEELFGLHILINPRSRDKMLYEYAWGELESPAGEYGSLFNRKRTYSVPIDYSEEVLYYEALKGETVKVYQDNTFLPFWTTEYFEDYFGDPAGSDYLFMYPESEWSGTQWHDAMVIGKPAPTASGFIYYIDRVVAPPPTIDEYLSKNQDQFGLFYDLAQRYASYGARKLDENDNPTYRKSYSEILNIADERGPSTGSPSNMLDLYTAFIPYDNVLQEFLDNTVYQYYESIDSVPELFLTYLLQSHLMDFLVLPSKMEQRFNNYYGDKIDIDINSDIGDAFTCSNGPIFAMNKILEPNAFTCVPGPIFYNSNYSTFLFALDKAGLLNSLTQNDIDVTLLAADNDALMEYGIRENKNGNETNIEFRSADGSTWQNIETNPHILQQFIQDHFYYGVIDNFDGEGFVEMASYSYVHYSNGRIEGGGNTAANDFASVQEKVASEKNGNLFFISKPIKRPYKPAEFIFNDPDLESFKNLLIQAELIDSTQIEFEEPTEENQRPKIRFIAGIEGQEIEQWTILAPTNDAIAAAESAGSIPTERDELRNFIYYHFAKGQCVFDDGNFSGSLKTNLQGEIIGTDIIYETIEFNNAPNNLSVIDKAGNTINIDHASANNIVERGVIHKINSVLSAN